MTNTTNNYGTTVVEFFKHNEAELQELISKKKDRYSKDSEGLFHKGMAANVDWVRQVPLEMALMELQHVLKDGFTIIKVVNEPLYLKAILRKPDNIIVAELPKLIELAQVEYDQARYEKNVAETARQISITVERKARDAAVAAAKAEAKRQTSDEQKALADLLRAYAKPTDIEAESLEVTA
ncbi:hypothetical protein [Pseudomonas donghuensis]|uniref:hypothetical protein n=1 Tax=Pseudomonas donghuensis TaxID=1163398 RepID=UPI00215E4FA6|nr:hypothetical protein [Pseudomonas donghuensis]UVL23719.1 hypothetical protein LOY30_23365 [Pseudomonas donghuensis]